MPQPHYPARRKPSGVGRGPQIAHRALIRKDTETMLTSILAKGETAIALPMPAPWFGIGAIVLFGLLLVATLAFRNAGNRH
jgi:hypothetical protein